MSVLPPGLSLALRLLAVNVVVCAALYEALRLGTDRFGATYHVAVWQVALATPFLFFAGLVVRRRTRRALNYLEMKRMGGAPFPVIPGKRVWGIDLVAKIMEARANGYPADWMEEWLQQYGCRYDIQVLGRSQLNTVSPEDVKFVLATEFNSFEKGPGFRDAGRSLLGSGVFNADGELWKFHRSMSRPFFNRDRITDFDIFTRHSAAAFRKMTDRLRTGVAVDFQDIAARFALDSATEFLFGTSVESLQSTLPYPWNVPPPPGTTTTKSAADRFVKAFAEAQLVTTLRLWLGPIWPFYEMFSDRTKQHMKEINDFIDPILQRALLKKHRDTRPSKGRLVAKPKPELPTISEDESTTLLDHLVTLTDDAKVIKDEIINIMVAGRDTTSVTLTFAIYFMAMHPEVFRRAREEVIGKLGTSRTPSYDDLRDMRYLRAVINETLRLMPPVPFNVRTSNRSVLLPSKNEEGKHFYVPAGTGVSYSVLVMHRRKELWGPDADEFDPDRFIDERLHKYLTRNPYIFVPFNAGPRICLGQQFAYNEMTFFLVKFLQTFDGITLDKVAQPPDARPPAEWKNGRGRKAVEEIMPTAHLTLFVKGGLWVRLHEATSDS